MIGREQALQVKQLGATWTKIAQWLICSLMTVLAIASLISSARTWTVNGCDYVMYIFHGYLILKSREPPLIGSKLS